MPSPRPLVRIAPLLAALAPAALLAAARPAPLPGLALTESIDVDVVNVDVFVTGPGGEPLSGLRRGDFQILEDGKPVAISNFEEIRPLRPASRVSAPPGVKVTVEPPLVSAAPGNASFVAVYFDDANLEPQHRARVLWQLRRYLVDSVRPNERVMIASHNLGLHVEAPFTDDRQILSKALDRVARRPARGRELDRARSTALRAMLDLQKASANRGTLCDADVKAPVASFAQMARDEALRTLEALTLLVDSLSGLPGRKSLLLVSDGIPLNPGEELNEAFIQMCGGGASRSGAQLGDVPLVDYRGHPDQVYTASISPLDSQKYGIAGALGRLTAQAGANRVSIYALQATAAPPPASSSPALDLDEGMLRLPEVERVRVENYQAALFNLAAETGGRALFQGNQIDLDLGGLWSDLSNHYSLGYSPKRKPDGREHRIEVRVARPGAQVRNLKSFRDKPVLERAVERTLAALLYGLDENPLAVRVELEEPRFAGPAGVDVPVRLRIPLFKLGILESGPAFAGRLRFLVAAQGPGGGLAPVRQVEVPLRIAREEVLRALGQYYVYNLTLRVAPGRQKVAVAVRDEVTGAMSFLQRSFDVAPLEPATAGETAP